MPSFHDFRFLSTDGKHSVFARECTPDGEVRAVLQIAHGVAEHIYRYAPFMEFLAKTVSSSSRMTTLAMVRPQKTNRSCAFSQKRTAGTTL